MSTRENSAEPGRLVVSGHFSRLVAREIGLRERELGAFLQGSGLSSREFFLDELLISPAQQGVLAMNAYHISGDAGLGLRVGRLLTPEAYGPLGFLVSMSPNFRIAMSHIQTFLPPRLPFVQLNLRDEGEQLFCRLAILHSQNPLLHRAAIESVTISLTAIAAIFAGEDLADARVFVDYPAPDYAARYPQFYKVPVCFDAGEIGLRIPRYLADLPNPLANRGSYQLAMEQCQRLLAEMDKNPCATSDRVRKLLLSGPPGGLDEDTVARTLLLSTRTLGRRLRAEGTSFRTLRDEVLASIASHHLLATQESVEAIASMLNYYDGSNFRRAFKRWFGVTPEAFRRQQR